MISTFQGSQNILQHGVSVWNKTKSIIVGDFGNLKLPKWFQENHHWFVNNLYDWNIIQAYTIFHDCGKAFCKTIDNHGKQHFPNHAGISKEKFLEVFPNDEIVAELISLDMIMHTEKYAEIMDRKLSLKTLLTLYIVSLGEINANAELFNGYESDSFKIKLKHLDKLGKKLLEIIPKHIEEYIYIFTRNDIPDIQKIVQSCHAMFEVGAFKRDGHPSIVVLKANDERDFKHVMSYLIDYNIRFKVFREPMSPYDGQITSIVTESLSLNKKEIMKDFKLLRI